MNVFKQLRSNKGLTLSEVMVSAVVFVLVFIGVMGVFTKCMQFNELTKASSIAMYSARMKMEEIRNTDFSLITATYNDIAFNVTGINGRGVSYVDMFGGSPDALQVTVNISWRQPNGLMIGEDLNLNGQLDSGEDSDGNGRLSSNTAELISVVYNE